MFESQHIEYKQVWKDEYLKWICGFANAQGGTLFIGMDDNGQPCGDKVKVAFKKENLALPTFESAFGGTLVVIPRNVETANAVDLSGLQLTERQRRILSLIAEDDTILAIQLGEKLNVSRRTVNRELSMLQKEGVLIRDGSNQHGHWITLLASNDRAGDSADGTADGIADGTAGGTADDSNGVPSDTSNDQAE